MSGQKKILYVEDDHHNFLLVQRTLSVFPDLLVLNAEDADRGLEMARSEKPDLILVDVHLPGMNGIEMTRHLKADEQIAHIPVVALTANVCNGDICPRVTINTVPVKIRRKHTPAGKINMGTGGVIDFWFRSLPRVWSDIGAGKLHPHI